MFWGLVCLFFAFFAGSIEGTVIEVINKINSIFYGPILAAFILAIMSKKTHALGANIGILAGVLLNLYLWLYVPEVFWFWWNVIGCVTTIVVAIIFSRIFNKEVRVGFKTIFDKDNKKQIALLIVYFLVIFLTSII